MKTFSILVLSLVTGLSLNAQQRNLDYYFGKARENSPLINKSKNENLLADLNLEQINSILSKPEINFLSGVTLAPIISHDNNLTRFKLASDDASNYTGHDLAITDGGQYQALISIKQPLLAGSKYKVYAEKAEISNQINNNNIALTIHELEQVVGYQYILCIMSARQADNSLSLLRELDEQLRIMQELVKNAIYKQTDIMILEIEVQNYYADYKMFQAEYSINLSDLNIICGISDTSKVTLEDLDFTLAPGKSGQSDFLTSYKLDSLNILADQAITELKYKPQVDLFADAGLNAAYLPGLNRMGLTAGISLSWNIFDGHQKNIQKEKSAIDLQTLEFEKNNFMTRNYVSKNKILKQIEATDQRIMINEEQADRYRKLYDAYSRELSQGEVSVMDYKNLLKDIAAKKQEILQLKMEKQFLINSYNYLNY